MTNALRYRVVVANAPVFPAPSRTVIRSGRLRLKRLAHGRKT